MYFRQLKLGRKNPAAFIYWKHKDELDYNGGIRLDPDAGHDFFTNGNKLSFKLQLIF